MQNHNQIKMLQKHSKLLNRDFRNLKKLIYLIKLSDCTCTTYYEYNYMYSSTGLIQK